MVASTRARIALAALLGIFLIPLLTSSLSGLTHVLTCESETASAFSIEAGSTGPPVVMSATSVTRDEDTGLCGGLTLDMGVGPAEPGKVKIVIPITNNTRYPWRGSVKLVLDGNSVPLAIGEIQPGGTETGSVVIPVGQGKHEIDGTLLIGP